MSVDMCRVISKKKTAKRIATHLRCKKGKLGGTCSKTAGKKSCRIAGAIRS